MTTTTKNAQKLVAAALASALTLCAASPALAATAGAAAPTTAAPIVAQQGWIGEYAAYECARDYLGLYDCNILDYTVSYEGGYYEVTLNVCGEGIYVIYVDEYSGCILW